MLRDASANYWSDVDLTASINRAMKQRDLDSGQNRLVQSLPLVIGQNEYTINTGSFNARTIAINGIVVIYGNARKLLLERSLTEAAGQNQVTTTYTSIPDVFAKMSPTEVYVAPKPNQAYLSEWHTTIVAAGLVNPQDADPLPYPWTDPVPFLAAHYARLELQQYDEAQQYKQLYLDSLSDVSGGTSPMVLRSPYAGSRSRL